jgi:hypothetical protein
MAVWPCRAGAPGCLWFRVTGRHFNLLLREFGVVLGIQWRNRLVCSWHSYFSHVSHISLIAVSLKALRVCVKFDVKMRWALKMLTRTEKNRQFSEEYSTIREATAHTLNHFSIGSARFLRAQHRRASAKISVSFLEPSMKPPLPNADAGFVTVPWFLLEPSIFTRLDLHWHLKKWTFEFFQFMHQSVRDFCQKEFHYNGVIINGTCTEYIDKISAETIRDCSAYGPLLHRMNTIEKVRGRFRHSRRRSGSCFAPVGLTHPDGRTNKRATFWIIRDWNSSIQVDARMANWRPSNLDYIMYNHGASSFLIRLSTGVRNWPRNMRSTLGSLNEHWIILQNNQ